MTDDSNTTRGVAAEGGNPLYEIFRHYGSDYWSVFAFGLVASILQMGLGRLPALVTGVAFDALFFGTVAYELPLVPGSWIPDGRMSQFWFTVALLAGTYVLVVLFSTVGVLATQWFTKRLLHDVRTDTYDVMQRLSLGYFDGEDTGEIISILNNDVRNLQTFTNGTLVTLIVFPLSVAIAFVYMAVLNWQLAVVLLFAPVLIAAVSYWYANKVAPVYDDLRERIGSLNAQLEHNISGIATIKAYTAEDEELERVRSVADERLETDLDQTKYTCLMAPSAESAKNLAVLTVVLLGGYWILGGPPAFFDGTMTAGMLYTFIVYTRSFVSPMRNVPNIIDNYENGMASAKRIRSIHANPNRIPQSDDAETVSEVSGTVEYDSVSFGYDDAEETIRNVSFRAEPGETIGIVGPTGAGKSTAMKLLFRFFDVDEGTIRIDGTDVRDVTRRSLRDHLGYVEQEPFLFYGTVRENIAYGVSEGERREASNGTSGEEEPRRASRSSGGTASEERSASRKDGTVTDDEVVAAATKAGAHEFIADLPEGYDTEVGERGVKLSGGQRQRIAIARVIVRDPAILVLDEATSHVDNETEAVIQHHLEDLTADRTTFVVAHRLSTVRDADRILVFEGGEIVERGTHDELIDADDLYANLWRVQVGDVTSLSPAFIERTRRRTLEADE